MPDREQTSERAAARVDHRLTYERLPAPRQMSPGILAGPRIPNAYFDRPGRASTLPDSPGDWETGYGLGEDVPEIGHIEAWFAMAVAEAMHEAMEWFWVDGNPFIDPHGPLEHLVHEATAEFTERLIEVRRTARVERGLDPDTNGIPLTRERRARTAGATS